METQAHSRAQILTAVVLVVLLALAIVTAVAASTGRADKPDVAVTAGSSWTAVSHGSSWT